MDSQHSAVVFFKLTIDDRNIAIGVVCSNRTSRHSSSQRVSVGMSSSASPLVAVVGRGLTTSGYGTSRSIF